MHVFIDVFIAVCLVWGVWKGFQRGLVMQLFTIGSVAVAIWAGFTLFRMVTPYLEPHIGPVACSVVAFIIVFAIVFIAMYLIGKLMTKLLDAIALGLVNRLLGAIFGLMINILILSVLIYFVNRFNGYFHYLPKEEIVQCHLYEPIGKVIPAVFPEKFR